MAIKLEINMTNKWLYSLIAVGVLLALGVGVCAYQSDMRAGDPLVMGHSAGEINVEFNGAVVSLQTALDNLNPNVGSDGLNIIDFSWSYIGSYSLYTEFKGGTRSPADKISNYIIIPDTNKLQAGKEYGFVLFTSGERSGKRNWANGSPFDSRCYNSGYDFWDLKFSHFLSSPGSNMVYTAQGVFLHQPTNIIAGDGSNTVGTLIAKNTHDCSDSGKGSYRIFVFEKQKLQEIMNSLNRSNPNPDYVYSDGRIN